MAKADPDHGAGTDRRQRRGSAMPSWAEPQLATLTRARFSDPEWIFERKLDGERCLAFCGPSGVRLMSRSKRDITTTFPEIAGALEARLPDGGDRGRGLIADGEIVAFEGAQTRFGRLQHRLGVAHPGAELPRSVPVHYYLFDVLYSGGEDTRPLPLLDRKELLARLLTYRDPLRYTEHRAEHGEAFWEHACRDGWEGLIAKRASAPYQGGRSKDWLKFKCENSQEFVIGGYTEPQRSRVGLGALLLGYYEAPGGLVYAGKVGTGFDTETLRMLRARLGAMEQGQAPFTSGRSAEQRGVHWVKPQLVAQVAFTEWTGDGQLRHPRFLGLRDDKSPRDVARERPA